MSQQISVSDDVKKVLDQVRKEKGFESIAEAAQYAIGMFVSRYKALKNYAEKQGGGKTAKKAAKKTAKKTAKK
jgi:metal-responsive CopG/Arc/MetJ family transcriptional regulator